MTKTQTVELLQKQLPGFYSVDQVIKMINEIEEDSQALAYNENTIEGLLERIEDKVDRALDHLCFGDFVDADSAEFSLKGNQKQLPGFYKIQLDSADINKSWVREVVMEKVREAILDYFPAPKETV